MRRPLPAFSRTYPVLFSCLLAACSSSSDDAKATSDSGVAPDAGSGAADAPADGADTAPVAPVVTTDRGPVRGLATSSGAAFLGIPFAAPPTGARRFRAPEPRDAWTVPLDATKVSPACPQSPDPILKTTPPTDEDCLTLNVWTPAVAPRKPAPVMVFIHGGGFVFGSGGHADYNGENLSKRGVVVVTINYRLGPLGFLAHPALTGEAGANPSSGNYGMLDQQQALRWVRDNAKAFGGDPGNVTIFGESAGAISVCGHVASPLAKGLFHRAISESGSCALIFNPLHESKPGAGDGAEDFGVAFAKKVGCEGAGAVECLRKLPASALIEKSGSEVDIKKPSVGFFPNVDGYVFPTEPHKRLETGEASGVPYVIGTNGDEGTIFATDVKMTTEAEYRTAVAAFGGAQASKLLEIFPLSDFTSPKDAFLRMLADVAFVCPARATVRARTPRVPRTYLYQLTYVSSVGRILGFGAFHGSELPFVFGNFGGNLLKNPTAKEKALSEAVMGYWTRFAATGDPNGGADPAWPAYTSAADAHLVFGETVTQGARLEEKRCDALAKVPLH